MKNELGFAHTSPACGAAHKQKTRAAMESDFNALLLREALCESSTRTGGAAAAVSSDEVSGAGSRSPAYVLTYLRRLDDANLLSRFPADMKRAMVEFADRVMQKLAAMEVCVPVPLAALQTAMQNEKSPAWPEDREYRQYALRFHPTLSMLMLLNGVDIKQTLGPSVVDGAMAIERAVGATADGWGVSNPPIDSVAVRLLVAAGADPAMLPCPRPMPLAVRSLVMTAWTDACARFGKRAYHPDVDVRAEARAAKLARACTTKTSA